MIQSLLIWAEFSKSGDIYQKKLFKKRPPNSINWPFAYSDENFGSEFFKNYLSGKSFPIFKLIESISPQSGFEHHVFDWISSNLLVWFQQKALVNRAIKKEFGFKNELIPQNALDDWLVKLNDK